MSHQSMYDVAVARRALTFFFTPLGLACVVGKVIATGSGFASYYSSFSLSV